MAGRPRRRRGCPSTLVLEVSSRVLTAWIASSAAALVIVPSALEIREEYCTSERFSAKCGPGAIVLVRRAVYGRLRAGRCITSAYGNTMGCYSDVTPYLDDHCSGRRDCSMLVANIDSVAQPCAKDFKSYLEVTYECVRASFVDDCRQGNVTYLTDRSGYLALFSRPERRLGRAAANPGPGPRRHCPWVIAVSAGQRINVTWQVGSPSTLARFTADAADGEGSVQLPPGTEEGGRTEEGGGGGGGAPSVQQSPRGCPFLLRFVEEEEEKEGSVEYIHRTCRSRSLEPNVIYLSKGNRLQIESMRHLDQQQQQHGIAAYSPSFPSSSSSSSDSSSSSSASLLSDLELSQAWKPYVLHYRVFGCADVVLPIGATESRHGDDVAVICKHSLEVFYVTCQADVWVGEIGNCTTPASNLPGMFRPIPNPDTEFKSGVILAVAIGVVLGMIIGCLMLVFIFVYRKGRRRRSRSRRPCSILASQSSSYTADPAAGTCGTRSCRTSYKYRSFFCRQGSTAVITGTPCADCAARRWGPQGLHVPSSPDTPSGHPLPSMGGSRAPQPIYTTPDARRSGGSQCRTSRAPKQGSGVVYLEMDPLSSASLPHEELGGKEEEEAAADEGEGKRMRFKLPNVIMHNTIEFLVDKDADLDV